MCTLWQRVGCVARGDDQEGVAIILAEKADLDVHHKKKDTACKKKREVNVGKKRKAGTQIGPPAKRMALAVRDENIREAPAVNEESEDDSEADRA
jgi:hypothetical protein